MSPVRYQQWVVLENIARFNRRLASETRKYQRRVLEKSIAIEQRKLAMADDFKCAPDSEGGFDAVQRGA